MQLGRTILILMLALSVALLPTGAAAVGAKSADMSNMSTSTTEDMSASMDDMDCCPHKMPTSQETIPDCCSLATCPMNCLGLSGTASLIVFPMLLGSVPLCSASNPLHSQTGTPPFRPPRA